METNTSPNCEACKLFKNCKSPKLRSVVDFRPETKDKNCVLVIGDYTFANEGDDKEGTYFVSNGRGYKIVEKLLGAMKTRYVFTTALGCAVPKDTKLVKKNFDLCYDERLKDLVLKYKPRVIICLGTQAMKALLREKAPKSLKTISLSGMKVEWHEELDEELNSLVLAVDHPASFYTEHSDKDRLAKLYKMVFDKAEKYALNSEKRLPVEYELVADTARFYTLTGYNFKEFAFDVENTHSNKDIGKNTIWKKNSKILSLSVTYWEPKQQVYKTFVVVGKALQDKTCMRRLFTDRVAIAHNISHDSQVVYKMCGVDIWPLVSDYHDTMAMFYLSDQNRLDNGLKPLSAKYLNIFDYVDEVQMHVTEANNRLKQIRKNLSQTLREKKKHLIWYAEAVAVREGTLNFSKAKIKNLDLIYGMYGSLEEVHSIVKSLEKDLKDLPLEGSADYGDIPIAVLAAYNAEDTLCTMRLYREILPALSKYDPSFNRQDPLWIDEAYTLYKRAVKMASIVSRNGMPLDMESLEKMNQELIAKELDVKKSLLGNSYVEEALMALPDIKKKADSDKLTDEIKLKEISPTKAKFITKLCQNLKLHEFAVKTKGGNWSFTSKKCIQNIKEYCQRTNNEELFSLFGAFEFIGNNRQVRSKFIKNWKKYYVAEDGCFHPLYKLMKNQSTSYINKDADGGANGRTASADPNMQQIRKVGYLRKHFKARPGYKFVEIDYCQLEVYTIAFLSNCSKLKETFKKGLDIYQVIANEIYHKGVDVDDPDIEKVKALLEAAVPKKGRLRGIVKVGFLAWAYGNGKKAFGARLGLTETEVDEFYANSEMQFSEVFEWKKGITEAIINGELITTPFGRQRSAPIRPPRKGDRDDWFRYKKELNKLERVLVNFGPQSLGSDICLWMACNIQDWIDSEDLQNVIRIVNLVHDSLWFEVLETECEWAIPKLQGMMEDVKTLPFNFDIPLKTEADSGETLASYLHEPQMELVYK